MPQRKNGQQRAAEQKARRDAADTKQRMSKMASFGENYKRQEQEAAQRARACLLYTSPSPRD